MQSDYALLKHCFPFNIYPLLLFDSQIGNGAQDWKGGEDGGGARDGSVWGADPEETSAGQGSAGHTEVQGPRCGQGMNF